MDSPDSANKLQATVGVVSGATSGIGRALAISLAGHGATVCAVGRRKKELTSLAATARSYAGRVDPCPLDLTDDAAIETLAAYVQAKYGKLDALIHAAGVFAQGTVDAAPIAALDLQYGVNLRAPYALTKALLPLLKAGRGNVVFIGSTVTLNARAGVSQYAATKHGLRAIADSLRDEVNTQEIRVLSVFLGRTATAMQEQIHRLEGKPYHPDLLIQPEDVAATVMHALTLPRTAEITEITMRPFRKPIADV